MKFIYPIAFACFVLLSSETSPNKATASNSIDSIDIKIGQMILIGINERKTIESTDTLLREIESGKLGGVVLFEKNISPYNASENLKNLIQNLQAKASTSLFISIDEEGGKVHRLKEKYGFINMPSAASLGALQNVDTTYNAYFRLSLLLSQLGINLNFAPCVDLAINPENKVVVKNARCFSSDPDFVIDHARACIKAHHANYVFTVLKHFPGHGSSNSDSHFGMVDVSKTWQANELNPYRKLISEGNCDAIMTAHVLNKTLDSTLLPATLSKTMVNGLMRGQLGFNGVVFSDDMQMHAISKQYGMVNAIELAINAGVDVLLFGNNVSAKDKAYSAGEVHALIKQLLKEKKISESRINEAYLRIMQLKSRFKTTN